MGFRDKLKEAGKKGLDVGKRGTKRLGDATLKKVCGECKHFTAKEDDEENGDCPIAGERLASADAKTCPQKAFEKRAE